jgi:hypothetical protein
MSKPISYYLSSKPPFPLESITKYPHHIQICRVQDLLSLVNTPRLQDNEEFCMVKGLATFFETDMETITDIPVTEKIQLAAAILMTACDQMTCLLYTSDAADDTR